MGERKRGREREREREREKDRQKITWGHEIGSIGHPLIWTLFSEGGEREREERELIREERWEKKVARERERERERHLSFLNYC